VTDRELDPWERMPKEPARAYEAFRVWRDAGPTRKVSVVAALASERQIRRWRGTYRWEHRARAWDVEVHRIADQDRLAAIRSMDEAHRNTARFLLSLGITSLQNAESLTPHQAARLVDLAARLERSALLGEHLDSPASLQPVDPDEGLSPLERIARELADTA
jgi:hypothetical protein